ncbi:hypothetical protein [Thermomonospora curvata]|uniref:hypothetical protein n=1 Tax=Thermomonospora curvata TaxID=2020 RepID=UPI00019EDA9A|nr:hypothetical protein [Thermomonospora curvata]
MRQTPPFRADHVGGLLRPPKPLKARADAAAGRIGRRELRRAEDEAIRSAIAPQREAGLRSATDGEFRRTS